MDTTMRKSITIFDGEGNRVAIEWNDVGDPCNIQSNYFGTLGMPPQTLELLYEALKELFN
jgi:hypothetical protein